MIPNGPATTMPQEVKQYYVRDASGNVIAIYRTHYEADRFLLSLEEEHIYGSERVGILRVEEVLYDSSLSNQSGGSLRTGGTGGSISWLGGREFPFLRGARMYELKDHRGNVMTVVGDKRIGVDFDNDFRIDYFGADILAARDYFPYGMSKIPRSGSLVL